MSFLQSECDEAGATIIYATHIFDGLESWPTHLMYLADGKLQVIGPVVIPSHQCSVMLSGWISHHLDVILIAM